MGLQTPKPKWSLPYSTPQPADPAKRRSVAILRKGAYIALAAAFVVSSVQFQAQTSRNLRRAAKFDREHPGWTPAVASAGGPERPKETKGAIGRWRQDVRSFWAGENIYLQVGQVQKPATEAGSDKAASHAVWLHPNMPFLVILLTPFAYVSAWAAAMGWSVLKLIVLAASALMAARLAGDKENRPPHWVVGLGQLCSAWMIIDDILHGNVNVFVLGAVAWHLWLYRRGRDYWAGAALALAICLKMTPAIFLLYWLYQRNWRLLAGAAMGLAAMVVVIPAGAVGPQRCAVLTRTWLDNLIIPGLIEGAWYPTSVNQSIQGVFGRYFLGAPDPNGNIFWGPDDNPYDKQDKFGWITLAAMRPATVKMLVRACQAMVVAAVAWAIGWRKLPRDDGRRILHYGLVAIAMLLLNQRTWDHHATVLLIADVAIWQAIAFGRISRGARACALGLMLAAGAVFWTTTSGMVTFVARLLGDSDAGVRADYVKAYGPTFYHFVLLLAAALVLAAAMHKAQPPYAAQRQRILGQAN